MRRAAPAHAGKYNPYCLPDDGCARVCVRVRVRFEDDVHVCTRARSLLEWRIM